MEKNYYDTLTGNRKGFLEQIFNLINNQFEVQDKLYDTLKKDFPIDPGDKEVNSKIIKELDNNSDYIQRIFIDSPWGT